MLWCAAVLAVLGGAGYALFLSKLFTISRIAVEGNKKIQTAAIRAVMDGYMGEKIFLYVPRGSYFLVMPEELQERLDRHFSEFSAVLVEKKFPNRLYVRVQEREFAGIWCGVASLCFLMDTGGVLYGEAPSSSGTLVMALRGSGVGSLGSTALAPGIVANLGDVHEALHAQLALGLGELDIGNLPDVSAHTTESWDLRFDASRKALLTLNALRETLAWIAEEKKNKNIQEELAYIDLRIEGRAYYKFKEGGEILKPES